MACVASDFGKHASPEPEEGAPGPHPRADDGHSGAARGHEVPPGGHARYAGLTIQAMFQLYSGCARRCFRDGCALPAKTASKQRER
eukprot:1195210-Prorocentrum_minimum.AAC.6